jgi:hypothetical protein
LGGWAAVAWVAATGWRAGAGAGVAGVAVLSFLEKKEKMEAWPLGFSRGFPFAGAILPTCGSDRGERSGELRRAASLDPHAQESGQAPYNRQEHEKALHGRH